jgi:hypothetical protein
MPTREKIWKKKREKDDWLSFTPYDQKTPGYNNSQALPYF